MRQFLAAENPLKMMKNAFYFTSKAFFVLKIFKFLSWFFGHVAKRLDRKNKVNFKFYDFTAWSTNTCNTHIAHIIFSPTKVRGRGFLLLKFEQRGGSWKNMPRNGGLSWRGVGSLRKGGFPNCFIDFSSKNHVFITTGILFFLSGTYSCLV